MQSGGAACGGVGGADNFHPQLASKREVWGGPTHAGDAVAVNAVKSIPLPSHTGRVNPVANDTESQVPQAPKPEPKKQVKVPDGESDSAEEPRLRRSSPSSRRSSVIGRSRCVRTRSLPQKRRRPVTPMFQKPGGGAVGVGQNNALGRPIWRVCGFGCAARD